MKSRRIVISGPDELTRVGLGAVAHLAIFRQAKFWGVVNVTLDLPSILAEAGLTSQRKNFQLALRDGRGRVFFGAPVVFDSNPVIHRVELPDGHWELAGIPIEGWSGAIRRDLAIFDSGVLASALFLSAIGYLVSFREARLSLHVRAGTRELSQELQHRTTVEAELRAAQSRYQTLVEINPDAVLVNFNKKIVYANNAAARLLGAASPEDLLGRSPFEFVARNEEPKSSNATSGQWPRASPTRRVFNAGSVSRFVCYVETVAAPLAWDDGTAVQVIMRDVTEQRRAEAWVHSLIETTQDAVVSIDRQARIACSIPRRNESSAIGRKKSSVRKSTCSCPNPTPRSMTATSNGTNGPAKLMPSAASVR